MLKTSCTKFEHKEKKPYSDAMIFSWILYSFSQRNGIFGQLDSQHFNIINSKS